MKSVTGWSILLLFFLSSCGVSEQQRYYLEKTDSLQAVLDSAAGRYLTPDTLRLQQALEVTGRNLELLEQQNMTEGDTVRTYAFIRKSLKQFDKERRQITEDIAYSDHQLQTLSHDIRKGRLTEDEMKQYCNDEEEALSDLLDRMWFNRQSIEYQLTSFDLLNVKIENRLHNQKKDR